MDKKRKTLKKMLYKIKKLKNFCKILNKKILDKEVDLYKNKGNVDFIGGKKI